MADLTVAPGRAGEVVVSAIIMTSDFGPLDAKEVTFVFSNPDAGIEPFRRRAESALSDHAFRTLHNEAERIRREAAAEERARLPSGGGFLRAVAANLCALLVFAAAGLALALADPGLPARLAQLAGKG